jgi:hypothetical protein
MGPMQFLKPCETFRWSWVGPEVLQNAVADDAERAQVRQCQYYELAHNFLKMLC